MKSFFDQRKTSIDNTNNVKEMRSTHNFKITTNSLKKTKKFELKESNQHSPNLSSNPFENQVNSNSNQII